MQHISAPLSTLYATPQSTIHISHSGPKNYNHYLAPPHTRPPHAHDDPHHAPPPSCPFSLPPQADLEFTVSGGLPNQLSDKYKVGMGRVTGRVTGGDMGRDMGGDTGRDTGRDMGKGHGQGDIIILSTSALPPLSQGTCMCLCTPPFPPLTQGTCMCLRTLGFGGFMFPHILNSCIPYPTPHKPLSPGSYPPQTPILSYPPQTPILGPRPPAQGGYAILTSQRVIWIDSAAVSTPAAAAAAAAAAGSVGAPCGRSCSLPVLSVQGCQRKSSMWLGSYKVRLLLQVAVDADAKPVVAGAGGWPGL